MSRCKLIAWYLILTIAVLRFAGAHAHLHNHGPDQPASTPVIVIPLGNGDDHGNVHIQDVDLPGESVFKKTAFDPAQPLLLAVLLLFVVAWPGRRVLSRLASGELCRSDLLHRLPPATAPPL